MDFTDPPSDLPEAGPGGGAPGTLPEPGALPLSGPSPSSDTRGLVGVGQRPRAGAAFEDVDDALLGKIVRGQLVNLSLNARDEDVKFKATKELADQLGLVEEANARVKVKHGLVGNAPGPTSQNLIIADERVASKLLSGLQGLIAPKGSGNSDAQ